MARQFHDAPELEQVAERVLAREDCRQHLQVAPECRIKYMFMDGVEHSNWLGRCYRTVGPFQYLVSYNFVIVAFRPWWDDALDKQREALIFHELMHIGYHVDKKGESSWILRNHDIEVFYEEVQIFGPWTPELDHLSISWGLHEISNNIMK